jgi:hypothetical protein
MRTQRKQAIRADPWARKDFRTRESMSGDKVNQIISSASAALTNVPFQQHVPNIRPTNTR